MHEEIAQLKARLEVLEDREATLKVWLAEEGPTQADLPIPAMNGGTPLAGFLRHVLADGRPRTLQEIVSAVMVRGGLVRGNAKPGRVVHFALLGLSQHGDVERRKDRTWVKTRD